MTVKKCRELSEDRRSPLKSEQGAVLLVVIILSTIALAVMTTVLYIVTVGSQMTGMEKRYRTALEAGFGGWDVTRQIIEFQNDSAAVDDYKDELNTYNMNIISTTSTTCANATGTIYTAMSAKIMTSTKDWNNSCDRSTQINPATPNTYDLSFELGSLGTPNRYKVFAKIVHTQQGNTASGYAEVKTPSGTTSTGGLETMEVPSSYAVEIDSQNSTNPNERAKLSILYQF